MPSSARPWWTHGVSGRSTGPGHHQPGNRRSDGRWRSATLGSRRPDLWNDVEFWPGRSAERSGPEPGTLEEGIPQSWEHAHYTRAQVDQAEAVITWHGDLIRSYAVQAASEKVTRLANETITMLRENREKVVKEDGSVAARNIIARLGKGELRTDAALREQVLDVLVVHRHLIPTARRGHYMMVVPHD